MTPKVKKEEKIKEEETVKSEEKPEKTSEKEEKEKRKLVIPGEKIISGSEFLPGDGTRKEDNDILASRYGLADVSGRLVKIIPLSGGYVPRYGNTIIGKVTDISFNGWMVDIESPYGAFLPVAEVPRYIHKDNLADFLDIGDTIACKVLSFKRKSIDLSIQGKGLGKLDGGIMMKVNSNKVPRVIGKEGSMIKLIKTATNSDIIVGQNGLVWIKATEIENELKAKDAVLFIVNRSYINGLTDKVKEYLEKK